MILLIKSNCNAMK